MKPFSRTVGVFVLVVVAAAISALAQTQTPPAAPARRPRPQAATVRVTVRDLGGTPIAFAHVNVSGPVSREVLTNADGVAALTSLPDGSYRLRFERESFVTLERELTVRNGLPHEFEVVLTGAPAPAAAPAPPQPEPPPSAPPVAHVSGPPVTVSIPAFLDKNFIGGREPQKESVLGCTAAATTRLLQLRESVAVHTHDLDEILYVVAGDGAVRIRPSPISGRGEPGEPRDETNVVAAGSLSVVPRGVPHAIERRGRNPLIVLSTLAGAPCQGPTATQQATKQ